MFLQRNGMFKSLFAEAAHEFCHLIFTTEIFMVINGAQRFVFLMAFLTFERLVWKEIVLAINVVVYFKILTIETIE